MRGQYIKFSGERRMVAKTVNLDALIPREDFVGEAKQTGGSPRQTISLSDLGKQGFFQASLRKPDFQRETTHWTPEKVVDLVKAFLDRDLIPAVILWQRGDEVFVIDGAHRLSALIAWVRNDYGDGENSNRLFGSGLTDEQRKIAKATSQLMAKEVGTYAEFSGLVGQTPFEPLKARRLAAIGQEALIIQWVTAATAKAAEDSFFKINQAAQPIDPVERRILQSRESPNAIASRCVARGGKGHKYWSIFDETTQAETETLGERIYADLYKPPHNQPVTSADQPIAGQGYNALPFVFDLVSLCNGIPIPDTVNAKKQKLIDPDTDGKQTVKMLREVNDRIQDVSTNHPKSFGFHPLIYNYGRSGTFFPNAFLASLEFAKWLDEHDAKNKFTAVRRQFEDCLFENKILISLTITRLGSGGRSLSRIVSLYVKLYEGLNAGKDGQTILTELSSQHEFAHFAQAKIPPPGADYAPSKNGASSSSRSAAYIREAMANPVRCPICTAAVHSNSMTFDHVRRKREGGDNQDNNLLPSHPYCNSTVKN